MTEKTDLLELDKLTVVIPANVLFQEVGEETVVLSMETGEYYGLNQVASRIWTLLQEGQSVNEMVNTLVSEYQVSTECLEADLREFLAQLSCRGLINIEGGSSA